MRGGIRTWGDTYMYLMYAYIYNIIEERVFNNVNLPKKEKKIIFTLVKFQFLFFLPFHIPMILRNLKKSLYASLFSGNG